MTAAPSSRRFLAHGVTLHALQWPSSAFPTVVCLHGWLDHAHAFTPLAERLARTAGVVALDFRGHGQSGQVPGGLYHASDYLADLHGAIAALGLRGLHLVGHSMGGMVALLYAAAAPEQISSVTLVESLGPTGGDAARAVSRVRQFLRDLERAPNRKRYPDVEAAAARLRENNPGMPKDVARLLALGGTEPLPDGGVAFRFDPAHRRTFAVGWDEAQTLALLREVRAPVQLVRGTEGHPFDDARMQARLEALRRPEVHVVPGGHHVHLERPDEVAGKIAAFVERWEPRPTRG